MAFWKCRSGIALMSIPIDMILQEPVDQEKERR